ncbi:hypothetical protein BGY98DRAFT_1100578 [Russula aff. rugulosa BPL654]|nr:hypothetical protein BGY98DRAFT_1100578 [Russula aff. rugulosa BPL654]
MRLRRNSAPSSPSITRRLIANNSLLSILTSALSKGSKSNQTSFPSSLSLSSILVSVPSESPKKPVVKSSEEDPREEHPVPINKLPDHVLLDIFDFYRCQAQPLRVTRRTRGRGKHLRIASSSFLGDHSHIGSSSRIGPPINYENIQHSPYRHPALQRNNGLHNKSSFLSDDPNIRVGGSSLDMIGPPVNNENFIDENPQSSYRHPTLQRNNGLYSTSSFLGDDSHIGGPGSTIGPPINHENPPYRHPTLQRNHYLRSASSLLGDRSYMGGSSSSLDTIVLINHENPQLLQYPSSTSLQSNGSMYNASFMTSPSYNSLIEVTNDIAEARSAGHGHSLQLYLEGSGSTPFPPVQRAQLPSPSIVFGRPSSPSPTSLGAPPFRTPPELLPSLSPVSSQRSLPQPPGLLPFSPGKSSPGTRKGSGMISVPAFRRPAARTDTVSEFPITGSSQDISPLSVRKRDLHDSHTPRMSGIMGPSFGAQPPEPSSPPQELHYEDEFDHILAYYCGGDELETAGSPPSYTRSRSCSDTSRGRLRQGY